MDGLQQRRQLQEIQLTTYSIFLGLDLINEFELNKEHEVFGKRLRIWLLTPSMLRFVGARIPRAANSVGSAVSRLG